LTVKRIRLEFRVSLKKVQEVFNHIHQHRPESVKGKIPLPIPM
jgi:hypothetical protein